jgi:hypothetical protein
MPRVIKVFVLQLISLKLSNFEIFKSFFKISLVYLHLQLKFLSYYFALLLGGRFLKLFQYGRLSFYPFFVYQNHIHKIVSLAILVNLIPQLVEPLLGEVKLRELCDYRGSTRGHPDVLQSFLLVLRKVKNLRHS